MGGFVSVVMVWVSRKVSLQLLLVGRLPMQETYAPKSTNSLRNVGFVGWGGGGWFWGAEGLGLRGQVGVLVC